MHPFHTLQWKPNSDGWQTLLFRAHQHLEVGTEDLSPDASRIFLFYFEAQKAKFKAEQFLYPQLNRGVLSDPRTTENKVGFWIGILTVSTIRTRRPW